MKPMDDATFQNVVKSRVADAIAYVDGDLGKDRARATEFYQGDISSVLPDVKGRSKVVSRDIRDSALAIMPSLVRIFLGNEKAVEFEPVGPEDEEAAKQATDYANFIIRKDNRGFRTILDAMKDALIRKTGIIKVWWDDSSKVTAERFERVDDMTYMAHQMLPNVEITDHEQDEQGHSYSLKYTKKEGKCRIEALPPEELIISRDARSFDKPPLIGHRKMMRVGELVAQGYDFDEMVDLASAGEIEFGEDAQARNPYGIGGEEDTDPAMREVLYVEAYVQIDADGDGILETRKVCCIGDAHKVYKQEIVDDHPFADFCPEPEPHTAIGLSLADCLEDIQIIRSQLLRLGLDGLASVVTPRLLVGQGVDLKAVLNNQIGAVIPVQSQNPAALVVPLMTDKMAPQAAMEAYRVMGELRQERTGQNQASMGLEADALQSTSRIAANHLVQQAQGRVEMIARIFAETGMRRLFTLILRLITKYQDKERVIRLRNRWVPMDPRNWNPDMDVSINVGLGTGNSEERAVFLETILQKQQGILQQTGLMNPWVDEEGVRNALEDFCEVGGRMPDRYFLSSDRWQQKLQQMAQQPPEPPKPTPEEMLAQIEAQKSQADIQNQRERTQAQIQQELLKDDRDRDKFEADVIIRSMQAGIDPNIVFAYMRQARQATPSQVM